MISYESVDDWASQLSLKLSLTEEEAITLWLLEEEAGLEAEKLYSIWFVGGTQGND